MDVLGLSVVYDGKVNKIARGEEFKEYPIGGLACEYARLHPTEIKPYITGNPHFADDFESHGADALMWFYSELRKDMGEIIAAIVSTEFGNIMSDYHRATEDELQALIDDCNSTLGTQISEYILKDTGFDQYGVSTAGQAMLSAYSTFAASFAAYMISFNMLADGEAHDEQRVNAFMMMYGEHMDLQHIDFKIMLFNGKFNSVYTLSSGLSLILFEAAHALDTMTNFIKCKNCGRYFVPLGRSDSVYCGYPAPNAAGKTCRDIGAQATHTRMLKNDLVAQEYRRLYMRLKMAMKRHPEDETLREQFNVLTSGMKERRQRRETGELSSDDILEWLAAIDN